MCKPWQIKAIYAGKLTIPKVVGAGGDVDADLMIDFPFTCFLLRNGEENILVDTGMRDGYIEKMQIGDVGAEGNTQLLIDGLAEEGLTPDDITSVIYTHLHYDHCGNGHLFTKVPTYIQKSEYANLMNPYDFQQARMDYFEDTREWVKQLKTCILVDGNLKLSNGLALHLTKGHSLGGQSIVVPTVKGRYVLTGDVPTLRCSLFPSLDTMTLMDGTVIKITPVHTMRFLLSAFSNDYFSSYDSHYLQLALAEKPEPAYFIPSHDPENIFIKYWG
jgi:glyoxylase-like metal-dependent hydrolase (beta-lactamase superfamily II)